jgi:alpha-beta hydrolase superfamily lysophospholipase
MIKRFALATILFAVSATTVAATEVKTSEALLCPKPWYCVQEVMDVATSEVVTGTPNSVQVAIRSGYLAENPSVPFRGNIIYYEGLGDSMLNHQPLFEKLTQAGFRIIGFDYLGQGGSGGDMDSSRIPGISSLGERIWQRHARDLQTSPAKNILGWSTGGLAAYWEAHKNPKVKTVVLIAPGIVPKLMVGEQDPLHGRLTVITLESLTSQSYGTSSFNPHVDPIRPSVVLKLPEFSLDFLRTSLQIRTKLMPTKVQGLVLLSGPKDRYVKAKQTAKVLEAMAPNFQLKHYEDSRHEIDNEREPIQSKAHHDILEFLMNSDLK